MALLKFKRSAVSGKVPALADLELGELAINTFDGKLYLRKDNGTASIVEVGAGAGSGVLSFNTRTGNVTLTSGDVTGALGFTPYNASNPAGYITGITSGNVTTALGYTPANKAGDTFTGNIVLSNGADRRVRIGSSTNYYYDLQTTGDNFQIIEAGTTPRLTISYPSGSVTAATDFRAPIFYDSNNTSYYIDPAAGSLVYDFSVGNQLYLWRNVYSVNAAQNGWNTTLDWNSGSTIIYAGNSFRAPIFYDYNNTNYYADPASVSNFLDASFGPGTGGNYGISISYGAGSGDYGRIRFYQSGSNNSTIHAFSTAWQGGSFTGSSAGAINLDGANGVTFGPWNAVSMWVDRGGIAQATGSLRAPIFYDSDDTYFNVNPNGTSQLSNLRVSGNAYRYETTFTPTGTPGTYTWVRISMDQFNGGGDIVRFTISRSINANSNSPYGGPSMDVVAYSREWHANQEFAVITYGQHGSDANAGTQYVTHAGPRDLAGGGYWFYMRLEAGIEYIFRVPAHSGGIGSTWQTTTDPGGVKPITFGVNYVGYTGNGNEALSNYWKYSAYRANSQSLFQSYNTDASNASQFHIYHDNQDVRLANTRGWIYSNPTFYAATDIRSPIFYDSNDTGYYVDPAGTSNMSTATINTIYTDTVNSSVVGDPLELCYLRGNEVRVGPGGGNLPIKANNYYDYADTGYYVDPNGSSVLNTLYFRNSSGVNVLVGNASTFGYSSAYRTLLLGNQAYTTVCIGVDPVANTSGSFNGGGSGVEVMFKNGVNFITPNSANNSYHNPLNMTDGYVTSSGSFRAPIFYDSQNTAYYLNPESTSVLWETASYYIRNIADISQDHDFGVYFSSNRNKDYAIYRQSGAWSFPYPDLRIAAHTGLQIGAYFDYGGVRFYNNSDMNNQVMSINNVSDGLGANNVFVNNSLQAAGSLRAPIFYDSNDTGYYTDPNGYSKLYSLEAGLNDNKLWLRGIGDTNHYLWNAADDYEELVAYTGTGFRITSSSTGSTVFVAYGSANGGYTLSPASSRAPIFYDSDNTAYYCNPTGNSVFNTVQASNIVGYYGWPGSPGIDANAYTESAISSFTYSNNAPYTGPFVALPAGGYGLQFNAPYSGGGSGLSFRTRNGDTATFNSWYPLAVYGSTRGAGDLYATAYYDANDSGYYIDPNSTGTSYRGRGQILLGPNTSDRYLRLGGNGGATDYSTVSTSNGNLHIDAQSGYNLYLAWYNNSDVMVGNGIQATIYYDRNSTGYYLDPASTSNLNRLVLEQRNDNYFVGSMAPVNAVSDWQSLTNTHGQFTITQFNEIGSYANSPSGVYTYGAVMSWRTNNHSFQLYASHTGDLAYKTQWQNDNYSGWLTPVVYGRNAGSASGKTVYGTVFYDTDNTGYFVDPASTSITNVMRGNAYQSLYGGGQPAARWDCSFYVLQSQHWYSHNGASTMYIGETGDFVYIRGYTQADGSSRAPIFYDSNNTGYYLDPTSESVLNTLTLFGELNLSASGINYIDHTGTIYFRNQSGYATSATLTTGGNFTASGNVTAYSDARLKDNVETVSDALNLVSAMRGVTYTRKDTGQAGVGVIAQEMREVLPEVVIQADDGDDTLSVAYGNLVGVLIEAIKELNNKVEDLEAKLRSE